MQDSELTAVYNNWLLPLPSKTNVNVLYTREITILPFQTSGSAVTMRATAIPECNWVVQKHMPPLISVTDTATLCHIAEMSNNSIPNSWKCDNTGFYLGYC